MNFLHPDYAANVDFWSRARAVMSGEDAVDEVIGIASQPRSHNLFASRTRATLISCQVNQLAAIATGLVGLGVGQLDAVQADVRRRLAKNPDDRFQSAAEVAELRAAARTWLPPPRPVG